jgi:hypothetical protein
MSNVAPSRRRWETLLWLLPFVLLALPNCGLQTNGCDPGSEDCPFVDDCEEGDPECDNEDTPYCEQHPEDPECEDPDPDEEFEAGTDPSEAIFCDIPKPPIAGLALLCATQAEVDDPDNISLWEAATALVDGDHKSFALDFSNLTACSGLPIKIEYFGEFPDGLRVCINCDEKIPAKYATMEKACIAKCQDEVNQGGVIPDEGAQAFCEANAKLATNHQTDMCYQGACNGGSPELSWVDPRKTPEPVVWIDHIGTDRSDHGWDDRGLQRGRRVGPADYPRRCVGRIRRRGRHRHGACAGRADEPLRRPRELPG